jgi:uncharacterized protein YndB with AHSA1/START domain
METLEKTNVRVETTINAGITKVWELWTDPRHILHWNNASEDWCTTWAENDLSIGGKFLYRMEARDNSVGFDFTGEYTKIEPLELIEYKLADDRNVQVYFNKTGNKTSVTENFETETSNPVNLQKQGWQAILDNFKEYVEKDSHEILHFETRIKSSIDKVYGTMIDKDGYRQWTSEFNSTSYFEGSWEKGSKILFIGTDTEGKKGGMVSHIRENIPNKFISIEHRGIYSNGEEVTSGPKAKEWQGDLENYGFSIEGDKVLVVVDLDVDPDFRAYFMETWPRALDKLKEICENQK